MDLALFDFDGTISNQDSFLLFVRKSVGSARFALGMAGLLPQLSRFFCKCYPNQRLKEDVLQTFFHNTRQEHLAREAERFCSQTIPTILRSQALQRLHQHQDQGDRIIIVSATPEFILAPWCQTNKFELLATRLELLNERISGKIAGQNCRGQEKVRRIEEHCELKEYQKIYAYGDTSGDHPMLALATDPSYRPFR